MAEDDKKRFETEAAEYFGKRSPDQFYSQKIPAYLSKIDPLKPPKPPANSYALFLTEFAEKNKSANLKFEDLSRQAASKWASMSEPEKLVWSGKADSLHQIYQKSLEAYIRKLPPKPTSE